MALVWALGLAGVLLGLGFAGATQVGSTRRTLERGQARRLAAIVAASAFDPWLKRTGADEHPATGRLHR
jgi:hypothetical protein